MKSGGGGGGISQLPCNLIRHLQRNKNYTLIIKDRAEESVACLFVASRVYQLFLIDPIAVTRNEGHAQDLHASSPSGYSSEIPCSWTLMTEGSSHRLTESRNTSRITTLYNEMNLFAVLVLE